MDMRAGALRQLSRQEIDETIRNGEFPLAVRAAATKTVVVMTQGWCPQWHEMAAWLPAMTGRAAIFGWVYDADPEFGRIMHFKETVFGNHEVPYLRYYHEGRLILACNWLPRRTFEAMLERTEPFRLG